MINKLPRITEDEESLGQFATKRKALIYCKLEDMRLKYPIMHKILLDKVFRIVNNEVVEKMAHVVYIK